MSTSTTHAKLRKVMARINVTTSETITTPTAEASASKETPEEAHERALKEAMAEAIAYDAETTNKAGLPPIPAQHVVFGLDKGYEARRVITAAIIQGRLPPDAVNTETFTLEQRGLIAVYKEYGAIPESILARRYGEDTQYYVGERNLCEARANDIPLETAIKIFRDAYMEEAIFNTIDAMALLAGRTPKEALAKLCHDVAALEKRFADTDKDTKDVADWLVTTPEPIEPVVENVIGMGDKLAIIGPSKSRKSFFALQLGLAVASGSPFLGLRTVQRRVLLVQSEIKPAHYHRRVLRVAAAMGIAISPHGQMTIVNARGNVPSVDDIIRQAQAFGAEFVVVDPVYKMLPEGDMEQRGMISLLGEFDRLAENTGASVAYVHHDAKGRAGDRDTRDRGSGSGVFGRDYDAALILTPHADDPNAVVIDALLRNYAPMESITARWDDCYRLADDLLPTPETSRTAANRRARAASPADLADAVYEMMTPGRDYTGTEILDWLQAKCGVGIHRAEKAVAALTISSRVKSCKKGYPAIHYITKPDTTDSLPVVSGEISAGKEQKGQ